MRIKDVNLGGGLYRLEAEPTCWGEDVRCVPTHVMDDIMRDVASKKRNGIGCDCGCNSGRGVNLARPCVAPNREPDGIDIHVDRPQRQNYGGWDAEWGFQKDLRNYRKLEALAKECNWPCREPMKGAPNYRNLSQPCVPSVTPRTTTTRGCACMSEKQRLRNAVNALIEVIENL